LLEGLERGELALEDSPRGRWLAALAQRLFGPRGPRVILR
jgi:hypothetical protein